MTKKSWIVALALLLPGIAAAAGQGEARIELRAIPGTPFAAGDVLVSQALGLVDWYRGGRLVATLADPAGLVAAGREAEMADRLTLRDAEGKPVRRLDPAGDGAGRAEGALFLAAGAPARIYARRGHRPKPPSVQMTYHGGYVMGATRIVSIFWGPEWASPAFAGDKIDGVDSFFSGFGGSGYAGILKEYSTKTARATSIAYYLGHVFDPTPPPRHALSAQETLDEACKVTGGQPDPGAVYFLYTSTGLDDPIEFCAYHTWWVCDSGAPLQVAYIPNLDAIRGCGPNDTATSHSPGLVTIANATAHELAETITDPRGEGWFDAQTDLTGEIADKCAYVFGRRPVTLANGSQWKIQTEWSNAAFRAGKGQLNRQRQAGCVQ